MIQHNELYCRLVRNCYLGPLDEWVNIALAFEAVKTLKAFINMPVAALRSTVSNRNLTRCRLVDIFFHFTRIYVLKFNAPLIHEICKLT